MKLVKGVNEYIFNLLKMQVLEEKEIPVEYLEKDKNSVVYRKKLGNRKEWKLLLIDQESADETFFNNNNFDTNISFFWENDTEYYPCYFFAHKDRINYEPKNVWILSLIQSSIGGPEVLT